MADAAKPQNGGGEWLRLGERPQVDKRDTFKYRFLFGPDNEYRVYGITNDLYRSQDEHRVRWSNGYVEYIRERITREDALVWLDEITESIPLTFRGGVN